MSPSCKGGVSNLSAISCTGFRSGKLVDCQPARARPIGVDKVPGDSAAVEEVWFEDFTLANSASSSRMRCWLAVSATGCVGSQDCIS